MAAPITEQVFPPRGDVDREITHGGGRFQPNGNAALVAGEVVGRAFEAARADVGKFTVRVTAPARVVRNFRAWMWEAAVVAGRTCSVIGVPTQGTDGTWTFVIQVADIAGAALEVAHSANTWIVFEWDMFRAKGQ